MSLKFFCNQHALFRFDPETCEICIYEKGMWLVSNDPVLINEIRYKTVEVSMSEALVRAVHSE